MMSSGNKKRNMGCRYVSSHKCLKNAATSKTVFKDTRKKEAEIKHDCHQTDFIKIVVGRAVFTCCLQNELCAVV